jgi:hypothetical protein
MHRNLLKLIVVLSGITFIVSCSGGADKYSIAVPKDAAFVLHINGPALSQKISWEDIKNSSWFKEIYAESQDDSLAKRLLDDPENTGVNLQEHLVTFMKRSGRNGYMAFEGSVKDVNAFENFLKKVEKNATVSKDGDINILAKDGSVITWNSDRFIAISRISSAAFSSYRSSGALTTDSLVKYAKELYALKGDQNLFSDKRFASLMNETGDMHFWVSPEHAYGEEMAGALNMFRFGDIMQGNATAMSVNFENGKITAKSKTYYNKDLAKLLEKYKSKKIDASLLTRIPSQDIVGVLAFNYPPEGIKELLKLFGLDGIANEGLSRLNYSLDEFVKAYKGDVVLAFTDFQLKKADFPELKGSNGEPIELPETRDFKVLFAASVRDKASFEKLVSNLRSTFEEEGGSRMGMPPVSFSTNEEWFAAGNSVDQVNQFLAGGDNKWSMAGRLSGHTTLFYLDLQKVMKLFASDPATKTGATVNESMKVWENIIATTGDVTDNTVTGEFEVNLVDKNTNALKQISQWADRVAMLNKNTAF